MTLYWPVRVEDGAFLGQKFGEHLLDYSQFGLAGHNGLDFIVQTGKPIYAAHEGRVEYFEDKDAQGNYQGYGRYAVVTHFTGYKTYYAHQFKFQGSNRQVRAYDIIGYVDSTGYSTAAHLHFGYKPINPNFNNGYKGAEDPEPFLADEKEKPMQFKTQNYKGELRIVLQADSPTTWEALCKVYGVDPKTITETIT